MKILFLALILIQDILILLQYYPIIIILTYIFGIIQNLTIKSHHLKNFNIILNGKKKVFYMVFVKKKK